MPEPIDTQGRHLDDVIRMEVALLKLKADVADAAGSAHRGVPVDVLSVDDAPTP